MLTLDARWVLTEQGWRPDARITVGDDGRIASIQDRRAGSGANPNRAASAGGAPSATSDIIVAGMPDAHCHAFQYGIAGLTERAGGRGDSFWTWRDRMYGSLTRLDAAGLERVATSLYRGLRERGYTSVAEFHYLHRLGSDPSHRAGFASALESAQALMRAAAAAGVGLLLLPVLYRWGGFGRTPLAPRQARFALARDDYRRLFEALVSAASQSALRGAVRVGVAPHSLRAVDADDLHWLLELRAALAPDCPVHVHVSEQAAEVRDALSHLGTTPIDWLCANAPVDRRWTLVHATHATPTELQQVRARGATVCVCTTTEGNLGDGYFPIEDWWAAGGALSIGSDSNVGLDPAEELRWLEYQARLRRQARAVLVDTDAPHPGTALWRRAVAGGRAGMGLDAPGIAPGAPAELLLLSADASMTADEALDDFVFARRACRLAGTAIGAGVAAAKPMC